MTFDRRAYHREWMARYRGKQHAEQLISVGKCPVSEILLDSVYHPIDCPCGLHPNLDNLRNEALLRIKVVQGEYKLLLVKDGKEEPLAKHLTLEEGHFFEITL